MDKAGDRWPEGGSVEDIYKWSALCSALVESAGNTLDYCRGKQPDWFLEASDVLQPFLKNRNDAYNKWLASASRDDLTNFRQARSKARQAIRAAKNTWFQQLAKLVHGEREV